MRNIIVVECISTGKNYIEDIINRGYNPVVLHLKDSDTEDGKKFGEHVLDEYKLIPYEFDMIYEKDTFEETLKEVRKFNPLLIVPGNERGVVLATKLSHELGLLGNSIENIDALTLKNEMHNRLAQRGLRSIKGKVVNCLDEALEFYDSENLKEVVIKPTYSAGSTSVRICLNRDEMIESINQLFDNVNYYGDGIEELLIQERINGTEYIVNTVTHKGIHRVTLIWKYNKVKTSEGAIVYDSCETVNELSLGEAEMVEYAYRVADALEIQYGPVHGEYMIDEKGPVLIEVNCRPCGGSMPAEFLDRISGQHETDSILDSYLKPESFFDEMKKQATDFEINADSLCYDCGIGFGKTRNDDIELLKNCKTLAQYSPLLIGASRKRVIGELTGEKDPKNRVAGSVTAAVCCAVNGAGVLRVHDVKETVDALKIAYILYII